MTTLDESAKLAAAIDHTILKPDATYESILTLCEEARQYSFAAVCVLPLHVERARRALEGCAVPVCTVVGFPLGATHTESKIAETQRALSDGATEIDMVVPITSVKTGDWSAVHADIRGVTDMVHHGGGIVKVIIETCLLTYDEKVHLCELVTRCGSDFIKTSTGFSTGGATVEDVTLLRTNVGPNVRVKASGGIRSRTVALEMIAAGADRLGTSSGVAIVTG